MSIAKRAANNFFWIFMSEVCAKGLNFLGTVYLARTLMVAGFGLYSLAIATSLYIWVVVDIGITEYGTREVARNTTRANDMLNSLNSLRLTLAVISILLFGGILFILKVPDETRWALLAGSLMVLPYSIFPDWVLKGMERMEYLALGNFIIGVVFLVGIYFLVKNPADIITASLYRSLVYLPGSLVILSILKRKMGVGFSFSFTPLIWWEHLKESWCFAVNAGVFLINRYIPLFFLGILATNKDVGLFSAPLRLVFLLITGAILIHGTSYPILSNLYLEDRHKFRETHKSLQKLVIYIGLPMGIVGMSLSGELVKLVYGNYYAETAGILKILIWIVPLKFLRGDYSRLLACAGLQKFSMFASLIGTSLTVALCFLFIPSYGGYGAAWAVMAGDGLSLLAELLMFGVKIYYSNPFDFYFLKVAMVSLAVGAILYKIYLPLLFKISIGIVIYGIISLLFGLISMKKLLIFYQAAIGTN